MKVSTLLKKKFNSFLRKGSLIFRNGTENQEKKYQFSNPSYSIEDDTFFDSNNTNEISKPFGSTEEVNNLRENSFLIES